MSLYLKLLPVFDINTGETTTFRDYSGIYAPDNLGGYNYPNTNIFAITATRFIFSSYLKEQSLSTTTEIVSGTEYTVGGTGSFTYDTKLYTTGDIFISMQSGTPTLSNCTITATGGYSPATIFLPLDVYTSDFTPSLFGIDSLTFPDSVYSVLYSVYTTKYFAQAGIPAGTYLVGGTVGQTVIISGVTYRVNEQFTASGVFTMTGTGFISLYDASTTTDDSVSPHYFQFSYTAFQEIKNLELQIASSSCKCVAKKQETLNDMNTLYLAIKANFEGDLGLDISGTQTMLDRINWLALNACDC